MIDGPAAVLYSVTVIERRRTRQIQLGKVKVGGDAPISVQSMTKTDTRDVRATVQQIWDLEAAGCDIARVAVPVREAAEQLGEIKRKIRIPLVVATNTSTSDEQVRPVTLHSSPAWARPEIDHRAAAAAPVPAPDRQVWFRP